MHRVPVAPEACNGACRARALLLVVLACIFALVLGGCRKRELQLIGKRLACSGGRTSACVDLGVDYQLGRGVRKDPAKAFALYQKACNAGDAHGCFDLGVVYEHGEGVAKDQHKAVALYRKSCDASDPHGCANLGFDYELGRGVAKDPHKAVAL